MAQSEEMKQAMATRPWALNIRGRKSPAVEAFNAAAAKLRAEGKPLFLTPAQRAKVNLSSGSPTPDEK